MFRTKATVVWGFGFPAFWYLLTSTVFLPDAETVGGAAVLADVKGGTAVSLGLFGVLTVTLVAFAGALTVDLTEKRYRKLRSLPVAPSADFAGRFLAGLVVAAVSYLLVVAVGYLDGADYAIRGGWSIPVVVAAFVLFSLVGVSVAVLVTWVVEDTDVVLGITNAILLVSYFLTGFNGLSPGILPDATRGIVNVAPNSMAARLQIWHLTEAQATAVGGGGGGVTPPPLPVGPEYVAFLAAWAVVFAAFGAVVMSRGVYRGEGGE
jgi:ABC-2 type transport system permease protein